MPPMEARLARRKRGCKGGLVRESSRSDPGRETVGAGLETVPVASAATLVRYSLIFQAVDIQDMHNGIKPSRDGRKERGSERESP